MANQTNAVAPYTSSDVMVPRDFNEDLDLIIQTYAKDLTPTEMSLFAADAHQRGLSIVKRQIYAVKYNGRMTIMVGIDGYRSMAENHPEYAGQDGPYWCGPDGQWTDVWLAKDPPAAAKVGVSRRGFDKPVYAVALWSEFGQPNKDMWKKFPSIMLAKCAEAQAIRKAFPDKLGGTYVQEEMDQARPIEANGRVVDRSTGEVTATVDDPDPQRELNAAKKQLWELVKAWGWSGDDLDLVVADTYGDVGITRAADLDTEQLTKMREELAATDPAERDDLIALLRKGVAA